MLDLVLPMADRPPPTASLLFMGTPDFAVPSLDALVEAGYRPTVVTGPDKPRGRGQRLSPTAVKRAAERHSLDVWQPASVKDRDFAARVQALAPDLIVVVAFRILPPAVYEAARLGAFNLHASLLPAYRGAAPINRALMDGVSETGVTTFFLQRRVDTGAILLQRAVPVGPDMTAGELHDALSEVGADVVVDTVQRIEAGEAVGQPQDDTLASPAPKLFKDDARIDWAQPAETVHNHVRGLSPYPAAWTTVDGETWKLYRTRLVDDTTVAERSGPPGVLLDTDGRLVVACGSGAVEVLEVQRQGKRRMATGDFLHGVELQVGMRLGA
ncbi:MAG: methionyl-tRNA formyltransferase [Bacteroidota bacterium]